MKEQLKEKDIEINDLKPQINELKSKIQRMKNTKNNNIDSSAQGTDSGQERDNNEYKSFFSRILGY